MGVEWGKSSVGLSVVGFVIQSLAAAAGPRIAAKIADDRGIESSKVVEVAI